MCVAADPSFGVRDTEKKTLPEQCAQKWDQMGTQYKKWLSYDVRTSGGLGWAMDGHEERKRRFAGWGMPHPGRLLGNSQELFDVVHRYLQKSPACVPNLVYSSGGAQAPPMHAS